MRRALLLPAAGGGLLAAISVNAGESLAGQPYQWLFQTGMGIAATLIIALFGNWSYRRAYQRWLTDKA